MPSIFTAVAVLFALLWASDKVGWVTAVIIMLFFIVAAIWLSGESEKKEKNNLEMARDHLSKLLDKNRQLVDRTALHTFKKSHMGVIKADRFHKEITEFLETHASGEVRSLLASSGTNISNFYLNNMADHVAQNAFNRLDSNRQIEKPASEMSPTEYESTCAKLFRARGWAAEVTPATGDQGVDIIIRKDGKSGVVQCKRYATPVGNSAVQEVIAGRSYYRASIAIVVSPSGFTRSAKQLADSTGVHLLHHEEIKDFMPA